MRNNGFFIYKSTYTEERNLACLNESDPMNQLGQRYHLKKPSKSNRQNQRKIVFLPIATSPSYKKEIFIEETTATTTTKQSKRTGTSTNSNHSKTQNFALCVA